MALTTWLALVGLQHSLRRISQSEGPGLLSSRRMPHTRVAARSWTLPGSALEVHGIVQFGPVITRMFISFP